MVVSEEDALMDCMTGGKRADSQGAMVVMQILD